MLGNALRAIILAQSRSASSIYMAMERFEGLLNFLRSVRPWMYSYSFFASRVLLHLRLAGFDVPEGSVPERRPPLTACHPAALLFGVDP